MTSGSHWVSHTCISEDAPIGKPYRYEHPIHGSWCALSRQIRVEALLLECASAQSRSLDELLGIWDDYYRGGFSLDPHLPRGALELAWRKGERYAAKGTSANKGELGVQEEEEGEGEEGEEEEDEKEETKMLEVYMELDPFDSDNEDDPTGANEVHEVTMEVRQKLVDLQDELIRLGSLDKESEDQKKTIAAAKAIKETVEEDMRRHEDERQFGGDHFSCDGLAGEQRLDMLKSRIEAAMTDRDFSSFAVKQGYVHLSDLSLHRIAELTHRADTAANKLDNLAGKAAAETTQGGAPKESPVPGEREKEKPKRQRWEPTSNSSDEEVVALPLPNRILFVGRHVSSDTQPCSGHVTMLCRIPASVGHIPPLCRL